MANTSIFNPRKRRLLRDHISVLENMVTLALLFLLAGVVIWVALQKSQYNPQDRDIAVDLLRDPDPPRLYSPALRTWSESGTTVTAEPLELGLFPAAILDSEWQPASRLREFNADNLYEKINGEAEKFLRQGFQTLHYIVLKSQGDDAEIAIELYDQGDMKGSMGIFAEHLSGDREIEQSGQVVFFRTTIGMIGRNGRFFFRVAGDRASEQVQLKAEQLTKAFAQLQDNTEDAPEAFRILQVGLGIAPEQITYQSKNVFQYDFVEDFWFGSLDQGGLEQVFIHSAQSTKAAGELFEQILEEQSYEYELVERKDRRAILWHAYLQNYFVITHQGRFIFGMENVADKDRVALIQQQFTQELAGD